MRPPRPRVFFAVQADDQVLGRLEFELFEDVAPRTVKNFQSLCCGVTQFGRKLHYAGSALHHIVPGFVCQGGDLTSGDGKGGASSFGGFEFEKEHSKRTHHSRGSLSMVSSGPTTCNGSQFLICFGPQHGLDGTHVVFGRVVRGLEVLDLIENAGSANGRPLRKVFIADCGEVADSGETSGQKRKSGGVRYPALGGFEALKPLPAESDSSGEQGASQGFSGEVSAFAGQHNMDRDTDHVGAVTPAGPSIEAHSYPSSNESLSEAPEQRQRSDIPINMASWLSGESPVTAAQLRATPQTQGSSSRHYPTIASTGRQTSTLHGPLSGSAAAQPDAAPVSKLAPQRSNALPRKGVQQLQPEGTIPQQASKGDKQEAGAGPPSSGFLRDSVPVSGSSVRLDSADASLAGWLSIGTSSLQASGSGLLASPGNHGEKQQQRQQQQEPKPAAMPHLCDAGVQDKAEYARQTMSVPMPPRRGPVSSDVDNRVPIPADPQGVQGLSLVDGAQQQRQQEQQSAALPQGSYPSLVGSQDQTPKGSRLLDRSAQSINIPVKDDAAAGVGDGSYPKVTGGAAGGVSGGLKPPQPPVQQPSAFVGYPPAPFSSDLLQPQQVPYPVVGTTQGKLQPGPEVPPPSGTLFGMASLPTNNSGSIFQTQGELLTSSDVSTVPWVTATAPPGAWLHDSARNGDIPATLRNMPPGVGPAGSTLPSVTVPATPAAASVTGTLTSVASTATQSNSPTTGTISASSTLGSGSAQPTDGGPPASQNPLEPGPFGPHLNDPHALFDDSNAARGGANPIRRIEYRSGALLNGLRVTYGSEATPWRGRSRGEPGPALELAEDEYITHAIVYSNSSAVCALQLFTNKRDKPVCLGSTRQHTHDDRASPPAQAGPYRLVALKGSADACIMSLQLVWARVPVPGMEVDVTPSNFTELTELTRDAQRGVKVYKAKCMATGQTVAIKSLQGRRPGSKTGGATEKDLRKFQEEGDLMLRLHHPHIGRRLGMGRVEESSGPSMWLVMEYYPHSLLSLMRNKQAALSTKTKEAVALELAQGMAYLHAQDPPIIHRDLKPDNVLLDENMHVKIIDFGISRVAPEEARLKTDTGAGVPAYLAKEVLAPTQTNGYSSKADVYSFGVILWELATGQEAYAGLHRVQVIAKRIHGKDGGLAKHPALEAIIDPQMKQTIKDCLQDNPDLRPTFKQILTEDKYLAGHLKRLQEHKAVAGVPVKAAAAGAMGAGASHPCGRAAVALAVAAAAVLIPIWFYGRS